MKEKKKEKKRVWAVIYGLRSGEDNSCVPDNR